MDISQMLNVVDVSRPPNAIETPLDNPDVPQLPNEVDILLIPLFWPRIQECRIDTMTNSEVYIELSVIMTGRRYSWATINFLIQDQAESILFHDPDILYGWNALCVTKKNWESMKRQAFLDSGFNRDCLYSLHVIPISAGLGVLNLTLVGDRS